MAALQNFARSRFSALLHYPVNPSGSSCIVSAIAQIQHRWASYKSSPQYKTPEDYTNYEISKDPNEWKYVERLIGYKTIPKAPAKDVNFPSGWKPARALPADHPYFIERTKNYMQPVYLHRSFRGMRRITMIDRIQGDIWALERDIKSYIKEHMDHNIGTQIHEFAGIIKIKGDYVSRIKEWMDMKGF